MSIRDDLKNKIFGEKNQNLDFILDFYYSLRIKQRNQLMLSLAIIGVSTVLIVIFLFLYLMTSFQSELNQSIQSVNDIEKTKSMYISINNSFTQMQSRLQDNTTSVVINQLKKMTKEIGIDINFSNQNPPKIALPSENPLSKGFKEEKFEVKINSISLKKLLTLINQIQNTGNYLDIGSIKIDQTLKNKLYFDVNMTITAYVKSNS